MNTGIYEQIVIEKIKLEDKAAFSKVFTTYYTDLVLFASTILHDLELSEEIVQDVFVNLWEDRKQLSIHTSLKSYLLKSIQNKSLDFLKHLKVRNNYNKASKISLPVQNYETEDYILYSELNQSIEKILEHLPEEIAETFKLSRFEGLKYHEIAEKLNVSQRTVEVRISKALQILREELKDYFVALLPILLSLT